MPHSDSFTELLIASQRRLYAYILTLLPRLSDAEEVLQETNSVLLRKRHEFRPGTAFNAWARTIAYFEALAYLKRQKQQHRILDDDGLQAELAAEAAHRYDDQDRRLAALEECVEKLDAKDGLLLRMRYQEGLSSESMASRVGRTAEAIRRHLFHIRTALLRCIQETLGKMDEVK
jgi:RNA polymerase sigma-70 factor (ECF subfamily)